jgi:hypothetical protein
MEALRTPQRSRVPAVKRFRDSHHKMALLFAEGLRPSEIAALTGYSRERVSYFSHDPAFRELVAKYQPEAIARTRSELEEARGYMTNVVVKGWRQLSEHFDQSDEEGELLPIKEIIPAVADGADRIGLGKHSTTTNINVDFAKSLEAAIRRSGKVIDFPTKQVPPPAQPDPPKPVAIVGRMRRI